MRDDFRFRSSTSSQHIARLPKATCTSKRTQLIFENDPDHPQRRAPQRIGVLAPRRLLVDRPEADQRVELVGERDRDRDRIGRHAIGGAERLVVILAGRGDACVLALGAGVVVAHQALQLGELADHLGQEIGLGEPRRALRLLDVGADQRRQLAASRSMRSMRSALRAELLVEDDVLELRQPLFERRLQIGLVEELRIRQPRADDALVAGDDGRAAVGRLDVGDEDEAVGERLALAHHEAFLVGADGGADHLGRDLEERLLERAHQHHRPFDEAGDLLEQALVLDELVALARRRGSWRRRG